MNKHTFKAVLQADGWKENVTITLDNDGMISAIEQNAEEKGKEWNNFVLPGFQNAHSHAFQYAMAGKGEQHQSADSGDDFWTWREQMYGLALNIGPDEAYSIANRLYRNMLANGYTSVAEFHYVHHQPDGSPYDNVEEMGEAMLYAAKDAGIKITLIPIFYQMGGFGKSPNERQKRFISSSVDDYLRLHDATEQAVRQYDNANIAVGIHSMRGVKHEDIIEVSKALGGDMPFHIHISEQLQEVEDCQAFLGCRPVEWMLDNIEMNEGYHLVHATHLNQREIIGIAKSGANVVICPSTEGNLGDGIFPLRDFHQHGGKWSIGTDSHVGLNPFEELRILDYGQRLISHRRNVMIGNGYTDSGQFAINQVTLAGRKAMNNFEEHYFEIGQEFDACLVNANFATLQDFNFDSLASQIVYTADRSAIDGVFVKGEWTATIR
ncbi:formimidoylglutamate deiminase [Parvicella tangerina]|uniref:8-oxoguanine deaminase n=1 Tax=Parvicella tangerina TaxID=2829795 RepID=A0A916JLQ7_9FLAO|nr:formimidoylglutamate deiminase [Parvicella tangerina]CAG5080684.1 8-oxoguanine deaminase [Parvicella tangerina]